MPMLVSIPAFSQAPPDALWLNVSPGLQGFDCRLLKGLAQQGRIARWSYRQTPDEPCSLDAAVALLHDYLKSQPRPLHLLGHGMAGLVGLLYARQYPQRVRSLTLLAVGPNPALDWQAIYYTQLEKLPCQRRQILTQMAYTLFGYQAKPLVQGWVQLLEQDLTHSPSPHSLIQRVGLCPGGAPVPLLICGSQDDVVVDPQQLQGWRPWLKPGDRLWTCPSGRHFFHATQPQQVANQVQRFWHDLAVVTSPGQRC